MRVCGCSRTNINERRRNTCATAMDIAHTIHPHPTLSEAIGEAALAVDGKEIHG